MDIDANALLASLFVSSIGFVLFVYGKKQARPPQLVGGLALMVFPYFVTNWIVVLAIAALLLAGTWVAVRLGW